MKPFVDEYLKYILPKDKEEVIYKAMRVIRCVFSYAINYVCIGIYG